MSTRRAAVVALVIAVQLCAPGPGLANLRPQAGRTAAAPVAPPVWLTRLAAWLEAVNGHVPDTADAHALNIGRWGEYDLYSVREDLVALVALCKRELDRDRRGFDRDRRDLQIVYRDGKAAFTEVRRILGLTDQEVQARNADRVLLRAAVLHADVARLVIPFRSQGVGCSTSGAVLVHDGNRVGTGCLSIHWANGRALLDALTSDERARAAGRLWYHAAATYMLQIGDYANARPHLEHGRLVFPADAALLFEHGVYHEGMASASIQAAALEAGLDQEGAKPHLEEAEELHRKALKEDSQSVEARVHRGFVLSQLGRDDEAAAELRLAFETAQGPHLRYYVDLFLGRAEQTLGNRVAARECYERASALFPEAQSPILALAMLARQGGDRTGAQHAIRRVLGLPIQRSEKTDPWWSYYRWQVRGYEALFRELYAPYLDGVPR